MKKDIEKKLASIKWRHQNLDSPYVNALIQVEAAMRKGFLEFLRKKEYLLTEVPTRVGITGACENVDTMYKVKGHEGFPMFLAQTGQLYLEQMLVHPATNKVACMMRSSRMEGAICKKADSRHLTEFPLWELEGKYDFPGLLDEIESAVKHMMLAVKTDTADSLDLLGVDHTSLDIFMGKFVRIKYQEAIEMVPRKKFGDDLDHEDEMQIVKKLGGRPVFVTHYPKQIKFFNMRVDRDDERVVESADLLLPYAGESAGSARREDDAEMLKQRLIGSQMMKILKTQGIGEKDFQWYLDLVAKRPVVHSGVGLGVARIMQSFLASEDIKAAIPFVVNQEYVR